MVSAVSYSEDDIHGIREELDWRGIAIEVNYVKRSFAGHAHLELIVRTEGAEIPVTETGYRSHFLPPGHVEAAGGPAQFVSRWLDDEALKPEWRKKQDASRQLDLFD